MEESAKRHKNNIFSSVNFLLLLKAFFTGAIFSELFLWTEEFIKNFYLLSALNQKENWLWILGISYILLIVSGFFSKSLWGKIGLIFNGLRLDLLINFLAGIFLIFAFGGFGKNLINNLLQYVTWFQMAVLISLPPIVLFSLILRKIQIELSAWKSRDDIDSLIISDEEGKTKSKDELNYFVKAETFAERVFNQCSQESLVFAIDAPWGMGKSTFVNLCKEYWTNKYQNEIVIYNFDILRYENKEDLSKKFIDGFINGLIRLIRHYSFNPELETLLFKYAKLLKGKKTQLLIDDISQSLKTSLRYFDKKIIVIIDDLDRLNFSAINKVLSTIKKAFLLPNVSYVLCYDTENIAALELRNTDIETITEFLEKFINIKIGLYLDNKILFRFFIKNLRKSMVNNPLVNPELVSKAVEGLKDIFQSPSFHYYLPLIGNPRRLKRLINTILLFDADSTEFENFDFDSQDLVHLLLIYINFPDIFRKIYSMETQGKKGLFSVTVDYQVENNYKNSLEYTNYLKSLAENQRFILNKIFNVKQRLTKAGTDIMNPDKITREMYMSYACFNNSVYGQGEGNLEQYLKLITSMSLPLAAEKSSFFIESKDRILSDRTMSEVLEAEQFSFSKSESTHKHLWRTLVNTNPDEFSAEKSKEVISYALNNLPQYSLLEVAGIGVGLRKYLTFYIVKLLDQVGWRDNEGKHRKDTDENIREIAQWIFGEGDHKEEGVLDILGKEEQGIMGLYDLLLFRLSCCADRSSNIPYLTRSLFKHGNRSVSKPVNAGIVIADEMRLISQKVFRIFQSQFINQNKNIFDEIDNLSLKDICGKYYDFIAKFSSVDDIEVRLSSLKSIMKSFIVDQLGNTLTGNRIGCGYYNANGDKDENSINQTFNEYLFEYCFNPQKQGKNYKHFMDCLLYNFSLSSKTNEKYMYNIKDFIKILDKDRLTAYWNKNVKFIKNKRYESEDRKIFLGRNILSYSENLPKVYRVLDEMIDER